MPIILIKERVRRKYLENEPCQPCRCIFPCSQIGEEENLKRFQPEAAMKLVKTYLSNKIGDEHLSNRLVCYVEKEELKKKLPMKLEAVVHRFMKIEGKGRKYNL